METLFSNKIDNIPTADSKDLAAHVVLYRAFGMDKDFAVLCMTELCQRRNAGDDFEYEKFIDEEIAKIPIPVSTNIGSIISNITSTVKGLTK